MEHCRAQVGHIFTTLEKLAADIKSYLLLLAKHAPLCLLFLCLYALCQENAAMIFCAFLTCLFHPLTARVILLPPSGPTIASSSLGKLQIDKLWFVDGFQPLHLHNLKAVVGKSDEIIAFFQCCGSGMFIPDPGSRSRNSNKREGWKKICCHTIFYSHKFHKLKIILFLKCWRK